MVGILEKLDIKNVNVHNTQVVPILLGVFMDTKEAHELRQAAFVVIINANPSFTTLQMIAHRLRDETSHQIRTLVYSSFINLALYTSHEPEHKELYVELLITLKLLIAFSYFMH